MEFYERQKALGRKVNPTKAWGEIHSEWDALPQENKDSYMAEAAMGLTQADRKARRSSALPLADRAPLVSHPLFDAVGGNAIVPSLSVGQCIVSHTDGPGLRLGLPSSDGDLYPLAPAELATGLVPGVGGKPSLKATVNAFEASHSHAAKPDPGFPSEVEFPNRAWGAWDRLVGRRSKQRAAIRGRIAGLLGRAARELGKLAEVFSADALLAIEMTFRTAFGGVLDTQTVMVHLATASAKAGVLAARENFIVCQPALRGDALGCVGVVAEYARRSHISCPPLPWASGSSLGFLEHESESSLAARLLELRDETWDVVSCRCQLLQHSLSLGDKFQVSGIQPGFDLLCDLATDKDSTQPVAHAHSGAGADTGGLANTG